jgi:hypothetical protein
MTPILELLCKFDSVQALNVDPAQYCSSTACQYTFNVHIEFDIAVKVCITRVWYCITHV